MSSTPVRPGFLLAAGAILGAALVGTTGAHLLSSRNAQVTARMTTIGQQVTVPADLRMLSRGQCPDQTYLIACWSAPEEPDALVNGLRLSLDKASGRSSSAECHTLPYGLRPRSCLIHLNNGSHAVAISVDSDTTGIGTDRRLSGSRIRIDAD